MGGETLITRAVWLSLCVSFVTVAQTVVAQENLQPGRGAQETARVERADESNVVVPPATPEALRYYRSGNALWCLGTFLDFALPAIFLFTGLSGRLGRLSRRLGRYSFFTIAIYFVAISVLLYVIYFPLDYYQSYVRPHSYGLSNQTLAKWFTDGLLELAVSLVGGVLLMWIPFVLLRRSPRRWWFYTWLVLQPVMLFVMLIEPIFVAPLFNDFGPMQDQRMEAKILELADRAGIEGSRVFEVNKSVDTSAVNAYVAGFGSSKRIVIWDTLLQKLDEQEVLFIMGHEMGHYVLGHIVKGMVLASIFSFCGLYFVHRTANWAFARYRHRFGFDALHDVAALPLFTLLFGVLAFASSPLMLAISRYQEREADRFGLEITQTNHAAASSFVKLQEENLGNPWPGPLYVLFRATHPTLGSRVEFCNTYRPWSRGEPLKYAAHFR
jgi:Zn-dependent protease with chaperone function